MRRENFGAFCGLQRDNNSSNDFNSLIYRMLLKAAHFKSSYSSLPALYSEIISHPMNPTILLLQWTCRVITFSRLRY